MMARTPPDKVRPAPPADGVRELLAFTALTAAAYVAGAFALILLEWLMR